MNSKVFFHKCSQIEGYTTLGIVEFETDANGNTTAQCRECGANLTQTITLDERLLGVLPKAEIGD